MPGASRATSASSSSNCCASCATRARSPPTAPRPSAIPQALSDVAVLEIVRVDNDGHLIAVPRRHDEEKDGPPPRIEIAPQSHAQRPRPRRRRPRAGQPQAPRQERLRGARSSAGWAAGPRRSSASTRSPTGGHGMGLVTPDRPQAPAELRRAAGRQERRRAGRHRLDRGHRRRAVAARARARAHRADERPAHRQPDRHRRQRHPGRIPQGRARRGRTRQGRADGPPARPARRAAGHHRRRGCARLRRRGVRRARSGPSRRLAPAGRHRRRRLVRAPRQAARPRRLPARHLGLFPRSRRAHAARGAFQPLVLAGAARGSPGAGGRDVDRRRGPSQAPPLPPRHDALGRAAHLHTRAARHGRRARRRDRAA